MTSRNADTQIFRNRLGRLGAVLETEGLEALLVFDLTNVRYLTGFSGSSGVALARADGVTLLSDFRYRLRIAEEAPVATYVELEGGLGDALAGLLEGVTGTVGVEAGGLTLQRWRTVEPALERWETRLVDGLVEGLRVVKDDGELQALRASGALLARTMESITGMSVVGRPERDVALDLEVFARRRGSAPVPFDFIVAWGAHGASPHADAGPTSIGSEGLLVVDIGVEIDGYASDMTRTFATGPLDDEQRRIHDLVREAQERAREAVRPGAACREVDAVARDMIADAGYGSYFGHGLGHGVGLHVHEAPRLAASSDEVLEEGMVVTVEPGVYIPGLGGVRIEDTVVVRADGPEVLTPMDHGLLRLS